MQGGIHPDLPGTASADDPVTVQRAVEALRDLAAVHEARDEPLETVEIPEPGELDAEVVLTPREAFFAPAEHVAIEFLGAFAIVSVDFEVTGERHHSSSMMVALPAWMRSSSMGHSGTMRSIQ